MSLTMWWPSPEAFEDLTVTDTETGWQLSAPDGTELSEWLSYWDQDEEHHEVFQTSFLEVLTEHANFILEQNGETEAVTDQQGDYRSKTEEDSTGSVSQH